MHIFYTVFKHISGLGMIFFTVSLILVVTDLENIANVPMQTWLVNPILIAAFFIINKTCSKRILEFQQKTS